MIPSPLPSKLCGPEVSQALARVRLFAYLDDLRQGASVVWVSGPAGAGKSTLAASYVAARGLPVAWYRLDDGDADPAGFVHHLGLAMQGHLAPDTRLPAFGAEYLAGLPAFARTFFEVLSRSAVPLPMIVFDDAELLPPASPVVMLLAMLAEAMEPPGSMMVLGRTAPWPAMSSLASGGRLAHLDGERLNFDREEVAQLLARRGATSDELQVRAALSATGGWPIALAMLPGMTQAPPAGSVAPGEALFDYLAREVLGALPAETRSMLASLSVTDSVGSELAIELSGDQDAPRKLAQLAAGPFLVSRAGDPTERFSMHALLRDMLLREARESFGAAGLTRLRVLAAQAQERDGRIEEAARLLAGARQWHALDALICRVAPALLAQGRHQQIVAWARSMPEEHCAGSGWPAFWRGQALLAVDPAAAQAAFAEAQQRFSADGDGGGCLLAAAGALSGIYFAWDDFRGAQRWIEELTRPGAAGAVRAQPQLAPLMLTSASAINYFAPDHPSLPDWASLGEELLPGLASSAQAPVAFFLLEYHIYRGALASAEALLTSIREWRSRGGASPLLILGMHIFAAIHGFLAADHEASYREVADGRKLVDRFGLAAFAQTLAGQQVYAALSAGDLARAEQDLEEMRAQLTPARRIDLAFFHHLRSGLRLMRNEIEPARQDAERALALTDLCAARAPALLCRLALAQILARNGDGARAGVLLDEVDGLVGRMGARLIGFISRLVRCDLLLAGGQCDAALGVLAEALAIGRRHDYRNAHPFWQPAVIARLLALALEHDIEPAYARRLIRLRGLPPPDNAAESWPWVLKIRTLGGFRVSLEELPVSLDAHNRHKPLLMLQALLALNPDGVSKEVLADAVWPDAEADAALHALEVNLQRLRSLLGAAQALLLRGGTIRLNRSMCWVDLWCLDAVVRRIDAADAQRQAARLARRLLEAYRGPFLPGVETPWAVAARAVLSARFVRAAGQIGKLLEQAGEADLAIQCYSRGIEAEPLAEELYLELMQALAGQGRCGEALVAFGRCEAQLRARLDIAPGPATRNLAARLRAEGQL